MSFLHLLSWTTAELAPQPFGNRERDETRRAGDGLEDFHDRLVPRPEDHLHPGRRLLDLLAKRSRTVVVEVEHDDVGLQTLHLAHDPPGLALLSDHGDALLLEHRAQADDHDRLQVPEQDPE